MSDADLIVVDDALRTVAELRSTDTRVAVCAAHTTLVKGIALSLEMLIPMYRRATGPGVDTAAPGAIGGTLAIIRALTPWRWPVALAVFSPYGSKLVGSIVTTWMTGKIGTP